MLLLSFYNKYRWEDLYKQLDYITFSIENVIAVKDMIKKYQEERNSEYYEKIIVEYRKIRNEYVKLLHKKNTAEDDFTDLLLIE